MEKKGIKRGFKSEIIQGLADFLKSITDIEEVSNGLVREIGNKKIRLDKGDDFEKQYNEKRGE